MGQRLWQSGVFLPAWAVMVAWALSAGVLKAQDAATQPKATRGEPAASQSAADQVLPGEVLPKVYVLKDKEGNLQAMPGITFEEFIDTWKAKHQLAVANQQPSFSIQKLSLSGSSTRERAELIAQYSITVLDDGWVGVPLRLQGAVVQEPAFDGSGEHILKYDPSRDGYVVWIRGAAGKAHQVTLKLLVPVVRVGPESHLRLNVPRAAESQLLLRVGAERAVAKVSEGVTLESARAIEGGRTQLTVIGLGGQFDVSWHAPEAQVAVLPSVLEATGALAIRINGRSLNTEAKLVVRSLGGEFDSFQVRLPPGADYVGTPGSGMSVVPIDATATKGKLYEVKLTKKTAGPVEVPLVTERIHNSPRADELLELAGFDVVGAVRQSGTIAVKIEGNWQVLWGENNHVAPVEDAADFARRDTLTAGFEYYAQPFSLTARVVPQQSRIRVLGEYVLSVGSEEAQLAARLKYTIRGAKIRSLEVELPGWEVDMVGPGNLVNVDAVPVQSDPLIIPLLQATSGELELTLEAHRKIAPNAGAVTLELPRPRAETIAPANVAVVPADNIELTFDAEQAEALSPQTVRPQLKLPQRLQDPLFFRAEGPAARFVASVKVHEQAITASTSAQLDVDETETRVDERIGFRIAYEPADHLLLGVPRAIRADRLAITLDGQRLIPTPVRDRANESSEIVPLRLPLSSPRIGRCDLQIRYSVRHEKPTGSSEAKVSIPLVIPGEGQITANELVVVPKAGISVSYPDGPWADESPQPPSPERGSLALSARRALPEVTLMVSNEEQPTANATTVERAWIQSHLSDGRRQDRAVYRFRTSQPRLQLTLPPGADAALLEVEIDGRRVLPDAIQQRDVSVTLPESIDGTHALEMRYHFPQRQPPGSMALAPVQIKSAHWVQQLYWQLVLPSNEHVLFAPAGFTREFRWVWANFWWQRQPTLEQQDLEAWSAARKDDAPLPGESREADAVRVQSGSRATNRYLFGALGECAPLEVYTISRARLVLYASLPLLVVGLVLIYFPVTRHPAVLFALGVIVAAGSLFEPESALLIAQAASLGLVLAVAAAWMSRVSARPAPAVAPVQGSSKAIVDRGGGSDGFKRLSPVSSPASTATDPLVSATPPEVES